MALTLGIAPPLTLASTLTLALILTITLTLTLTLALTLILTLALTLHQSLRLAYWAVAKDVHPDRLQLGRDSSTRSIATQANPNAISSS